MKIEDIFDFVTIDSDVQNNVFSLIQKLMKKKISHAPQQFSYCQYGQTVWLSLGPSFISYCPYWDTCSWEKQLEITGN